MPETRPELIYVAGAQKGERSVVMANTVVAGRQAGVDILINDEFASRRHFQLETTYEGWMLTNLSANGTTINGKRFKGDKKIILGTGDVIGVGSKTEMLFVEPGHDPEKALQEYRKSRPETGAKAPPAKPQQEPSAEKSQAQPGPEGQPKPPLQPPQTGTAQARQQPKQSSQRDGAQTAISPPGADGKEAGSPEPADKDAAQQQEQESKKKSKTKKYIVYGGVYAVMLVVIVIVLIMRPKGEDPASSRPAALRQQDFKKVFEEDLKPDRARNDDAAGRALEKGRRFYGSLKDKPQNAYLCVYYYREYKAYQAAGKRGLPETNDEQNFTIAKNYLVDQLVARYENAWTYEERGLWTKAYDGFEDLLRYLPEHDENKDRDVVQILIGNISAHTKYVNSRRGRRN